MSAPALPAAPHPLELEDIVASSLAKLKKQMFDRGISGTNGLGRVFKTADVDGSKRLDPDEFADALHFLGLFATKQEVRHSCIGCTVPETCK